LVSFSIHVVVEFNPPPLVIAARIDIVLIFSATPFHVVTIWGLHYALCNEVMECSPAV
jgi:hypothetical protein